jgi:hypothetical protein
VKIIFRPILFLLLLSIAVGVAANEWRLVSQGVNEVKTYVLATSLKATDSGWRIWTLSTFPTPAKVPDGNGEFQSIKSLREVDCINKRTRVLQSSFYTSKDGAGSLLKSFSEPTTWHFITPDTTGDTLASVICVS